MSINVSAWAIRRPLPAVLLFILLCAAGIAGFRSLAISRFPDISLPMVMVTVTLPGAAPSKPMFSPSCPRAAMIAYSARLCCRLHKAATSIF